MLQYTNTSIYVNNIKPTESEMGIVSSILKEIRSGKMSDDLNQSIIKYDKISHYLDELKKKNRGADSSLLDRGIASYNSGALMLYNGEIFDHRSYKLPPHLLFIPWGDTLIFNINGLERATWKKVGTGPLSNEYDFIISLPELRFALVTGQIMYEILINKKENLIINDIELMKLIVGIYIDFFIKAIGRVGATIDNNRDPKLLFALSKFFYMHILGYKEEEADKVTVKMNDLEDWEAKQIRISTDSIDYTNLYTFIPTMSMLFYRVEISGPTLVNKWQMTFGPNTIMEIEYFPALLTHLLALIFGVRFANDAYDLRSRKDSIYQRLNAIFR